MVFLVSVDRLPKQLSDLSHVTFAEHAKWKNLPQVEGQLESLELSHFLTVLNLIVGYEMSYDCCCHRRVNANELLTYMFILVITQSKILAMCLIKPLISDGGTHA
jgi:hypothetical protein